MNWTRAIEINRAALLEVMAEIFALLELALEAAAPRLPRGLYTAAERLLRPAESALRRLIVIAAQGLTVKLGPTRPMPKDLVIVRTQTHALPQFPLCDPRKRFAIEDDETQAPASALKGPRIHTIESFLASRVILPPMVDAARLCRRFTAFRHALETLPRQAERLARWQLRRERMERAAFRSPLRPGPPPGGNRRSRQVVHCILRECHALAHHRLSLNTS